MALFVLRIADKRDGNAMRRLYLWKGYESIGCFCRNVRFFSTRQQAEKVAERMKGLWTSNYNFEIKEAFAD